MAMFPSVDLDDLDVAPAACAVRDAVANVAREATYTGIGLGLLAYQRIQTRRREFEREMRRSD